MPCAMYTAEMGQSLCERMNGHKFDIASRKTDKPVAGYFNLSETPSLNGMFLNNNL